MLPKRSAPVRRDPRHVFVLVRSATLGSVTVLASRVERASIALATFLDFEEGTPLTLEVSPAPRVPPIVVRGVVTRGRDEEGTVLVSVTEADNEARARLARLEPGESSPSIAELAETAEASVA